ncbi:glycosyltransferase [Devosia psychrophila]|uniref:glycosyltransferase n=1 Tax=Devosia psychrophila TaxID=728005 RepID=UPI001FCCCAA5|nr:glycosyltransferase [Devosia psychrophila]
MAQHYLVLVSNAAKLCGVEAFARLLTQKLGSRAKSHVLGGRLASLLKAVRGVDCVIFNFPIVAWKRRLFSPTITSLLVRIMGRNLTVVLHEWSALNWKRRLVLTPAVLLATSLCFSAPEIGREFADSKVSRWATRRRKIIPIPPNIVPPATGRDTPTSRALNAQRETGRLIVGQFGSIYPRKQSTIVLHVAAHLIGQGHDVAVVFVGSFIKAMDGMEAKFFALADELGVRDRVTITGYVRGDDELSAIFSQVDVFCYDFKEGLTSRRGSVLTAALSGKPVVVNAPFEADALAHHGMFKRLISTEMIRLVPTDADIHSLAAAVLAAKAEVPAAFDVKAEIETLWTAIIAGL